MASDPAAFGKYRFYEVDCCKECNSGLNKQLWTLKERKAYIGKWLQRRYKKLLKMPDWTEGELNNVSVDFRVRIESSLRLRDVVKRRLSWASPKLARWVAAKPRKRVAKSKPAKLKPKWYPSAEAFNTRVGAPLN
jgi:hypothetical protein